TRITAAILALGIVLGGAAATAVGADLRARAAIVGGSGASPGAGEFQSLAYIFDLRGEGAGQCTGPVVAPRLILTAGHFAQEKASGLPRDPSGYRVVTGNVNRDSVARQISAVSQVIVYPGYNPATTDQDAALLVLTTPTTAFPIALATAENLANLLPE